MVTGRLGVHHAEAVRKLLVRGWSAASTAQKGAGKVGAPHFGTVAAVMSAQWNGARGGLVVLH